MIDIKKERKKLYAHLKELGILEKIDDAQIEIYLLNLKRYWDYEEHFKTNDRTITTKSSEGIVRYAQQVPEVNFQKECWTVIQKLASEFGLTPKSRAAIKAEKIKKDDEFDKLMKSTT